MPTQTTTVEGRPVAPGMGNDDALVPEPDEAGGSDRAARTSRSTTRDRTWAGLRGLKAAMRSDSSFFAHAYRGLLIALTASLLGVGPMSWCLLILAIALVLIAELGHSAIEALARAHVDRDESALNIARDIATAGVLVAVIAKVSLCGIIFTLRLGDLLSW